MSPRAPLSLLAAALLLAGCSGKPPAPQAEAKPEHVATPWDDMKKDEQRAKDVQKTVDQQAAEQRKQIEAAEQ
ncbi:hypothetical protein ISP17_02290 [Dyella ginsengisoli]|jgi:PBP1b-binding outer membrane lipoprotein LpoB|uniref:Lipoprotein n=1 Tax=Dyella ginsengisoli TaxID=363848 RepID=A0ABW8JNS5_9GAMM